MKLSFRQKLFFVICGVILVFMLLSWLLNTLLLERYYISSKEHALMQNYEMINKIYTGDPETISLELEKLERKDGLHIFIQDQERVIKYTSFNEKREMRTKMGLMQGLGGDRPNLMGSILRSQIGKLAEGEVIINTRSDERLGTNFLNLLAKLDSGDYIFLSAPIAPIKESADIAGKFSIFTGIFAILLGSVLVFVVTGQITRPILELKQIAQRMSGLDFSKRYTGRSRDEIGELGQSINSLSDQLEISIMELKSANQKLQEDILRKQAIDEMRKEFISNVSHELKTPIALVQGYAEGLKVNVNEDEENKNFYCDVIMDEAYKMNKLVKQLLELAQLDSGADMLERTHFDVVLLIEQILKKNELIFRNRNVHVDFVHGEGLMANADIYKVEQVFTNYLTNAVNHVNDAKRIRVTAERAGDKVRIRVYNTGRHIPGQCLQSIWDSFYKIDKARTRDYGGTGLGLSIVRAIQEAHQNGYGVDNIQGGVEFWFEVDSAVDVPDPLDKC